MGCESHKGAAGRREAKRSHVQPRTPARRQPRPGERCGRGGVKGAGRAGGGGGAPAGSPYARPRPSPAHLAVFETHVASDFPFEVCVVIILLYFRPGSYNNPNNKLHFMEYLSF